MLIERKLMRAPGLAKIKLAKQNGTWSKLETSDRLEIPHELKAGLKQDKKANDFFDSMAPSSKRAILEWINAAKTVQTKMKRISETIHLAAQGIRANHYVDLKRLKNQKF